MKRDAFSSAIAIILVITLFVFISTLQFAAAGRDDTFIMLWSAKTFTFRDWFQNYNGAHEEMASSILAPWIAAVGYRFFPETPLLFFKTASLCVSAGCLLLIWHQRRILLPRNFPDFLVPLVVLSIALSPMFEYWTLGGLETAFQTFLLLLTPLAQSRFYLDRSVRNGVIFALSSMLLTLTRTEGFIYLFSSLAFYLVARERKDLPRLLTPIIVSGLLTLLMFAVRFLFTGGLWPNPTYAKIAGLFAQLEAGLSYVTGYYMTGGIAAWLQGVALLYAVSNLFYYQFLRKRHNPLDVADVVTISLSLCVALHETFVVFCGGNWMEYYRFMVPTIPLKVLLLVKATTHALDSLASYVDLHNATAQSVTTAIIFLAAANQQTYVPVSEGYNINCAAPMTDVRARQITPVWLEEQLIKHNCAQGRDETAVLPFIRKELPAYVRSVKQVRIASYQAGYFPYHIRDQFSVDNVFFIDTRGLATRDIARTGWKKMDGGIAGDIDDILAGNAGKLSDLLRSMKPNMIYVVEATPQSRETFNRLGYTKIWDQPNAVIFFKGAPP